MAKKKTQKEVIDNLSEKLDKTPIMEIPKEVTPVTEVKEEKVTEAEKQIKEAVEKVKDIKDNTMDKIVENIEIDKLDDETIAKMNADITKAINEINTLKEEMEEIVKTPESKIKGNFTNYWNGTHFGI